MIARYRLYSARIAAELPDIRRAAQKAQDANASAQTAGPSQALLLDATALNLHTFYGSVERLFDWLARDIDGSRPVGPSSHRELLAQMAMDIPGARPPVIAPATRAALDEFMRFRHLVRNLYTWDLVPAKIHALASQLPGTWEMLEEDLATFRAFLDSSSHADEPGAGS